MSKPRISKSGIWWQVTVNGRLHAAHRSHREAWDRAWAIATYAQKIRNKRDVQRIHDALEKMENR